MADAPPTQTAAPASDGWEQLRQGGWDAARAAFESSLAVDETAEAFEGLSWAAWWLDDADDGASPRASARTASTGEHGDAAGAARMATWLAVDQLDFHGAVAVAQRLARARASAARPARARARARLARLPRGLPRPRRAATRRRPRERAARAPPSSGGGSASPTSRCSGSRSRAPTLVAVAQVEEGMRCLDEATATALEGEATIPISSAWACCFLVSRLHGRARLRACVRVVRPDRRVRGALRAAATCSRSAAPSTARCTSGAAAGPRPRRCSRPRSRTSRARARRGSAAPLVALAELRRRQGRPEEAAAPARPGRDLAAGAALPRAARARRRRGAARRRAPRAPAAPGPGERAGSTARRRSSCSSAPGSRAASSTRRPRRSTRCARSSERVGTAPLRAYADRADGVLAAARGDHDRARTLLEDAIDRFERERRAVRGRPGADRARDEPRCARSPRAGRARGDRGAERLASSARRGSGGRERLAAATARPCAAAHPARARGAAPARRGADEPADRRAARGQRAHRAPARHQHPAQARAPLADGRGRARGARRAAA